jgi:Na+-transporting methylmalonyl-CoA/oxaloacetate decarboxylase gamma subunit
MNKKKSGLLLLSLMLVGQFAYGQTSGLCINEVMTNDSTNIVDEYGQHTAWIEIFNTTFNSIDISSCYLTTNKAVLNSNKRNAREYKGFMYHIPKGDESNLLGPRQFKVFYADGFAKKGNLHTNFTLDRTKSNWIALYDANGYTLIDSVTVPPLPVDKAYALKTDGILNDWAITSDPTPKVNNVTLDQDLKVTKFKEDDPVGISMTIISMGIVFFALILLYLAFKLTGKIGVNYMKKQAMKAHGITDENEAKDKSLADESGDYYAAIAMALHEYQNNIHDVEDAQLTIDRIKRNYSPWSSKIYTLRHTPKR